MRNPDRRRCSGTTAAGKECRAWALGDSDPPLCSAHAGRNHGAGAPAGNQNRTTHGFYSTVLSRQELADLLEHKGISTLEGEIACARIALRRVLAHLAKTGADLSHLEQARFASLAFVGARTIAHLLRTHQLLGADKPGELENAINAALDSLSTEWGVEL